MLVLCVCANQNDAKGRLELHFALAVLFFVCENADRLLLLINNAMRLWPSRKHIFTWFLFLEALHLLRVQLFIIFSIAIPGGFFF